MQIPIFRGDNIGVDAQWSDALPQNMFGVIKPLLGADGYMTAFPGYNIFSVITGEGEAGPDRGAIWVDRGDDELSGHYRIQGTRFAKINKGFNGETVELNEAIGVIAGSKQVSMAYSFNNLAIVADGKLYYYSPADGLRQITGDNVGSPIDIVWGDNLFILTDGVNIYHSNPLNEEEFLPLDFGSADFRPDPSLGLAFNEDSELIAFGTESLEHFRNVGKENFVFSRITAKAQKIGIAGTHAKGEYANTYYMLGSRVNTQLGVYITEAGTARRISSLSVDRILRSYTRSDVEDSIVEVIEIDGSTLCLIHLPDRVLCFNRQMYDRFGTADAAWSTLSSADGNDLYTQTGHALYNYVHDKDKGLWLAGSKQTSGILFIDVERGNQVQYQQECILYSPFVKLERLSIDKLEMETISGFGSKPPYTFDGVAPETTTFISLTYDGITYSKEWTRKYGVANDHGVRFIARRLGNVNDFVGFKFRTYSIQRVAFAFFDVEAS